MSEQRKHPRVDASRIVVRIPSHERFRKLYLRDLSAGGLFVKSDKRLPVDTEVEIELWPPEWKDPLLLEARVVRWQDADGDAPAGMGMAFSGLSDQTRSRVDQLVAEYRDSEEDAFVETRITGLIGELRGARTRIAGLEEDVERLRKQNQELERDEADLHAVAERLATEKSALERRSREEVAALTKRVEEVDARRLELARQLEKVAEERRNEEAAIRASAERDVKRLEKELAAAQAALEEQTALAQRHRERADVLAGEVEKRRAKERDLRKLLSAIGSGAPVTEVQPTPEGDDQIVVETKAAPAPQEDGEEIALDAEDVEFTESFDAFQGKLTKTMRLVATDKLRNRKPKTDEEARVCELLQAGPTFQTLLQQIDGRMPEIALHRLLFDLHEAAQLELRG